MRLSIVVPNLNQGSFLGQALDTLLEGARGLDVECIVTDGGSTDGSLNVIERYSPRLASWSSQADGGQYDAVNQGFARSSGEIMAWLNSDDLYFPWTLRAVHSIFTSLPHVEWLTTTRPGLISEDGAVVRFRDVPGYSREAFADWRYVPVDDGVSFGSVQQESTFWRRSLWERSGGRLDSSLRLAGDYELWSRFFRLAELHGVDVPLAAFRVRAGQRGADVEAYLREVEQIAGRPPGLARLIRRAARLPALRGGIKRIPRYSAPVVAGGLNADWSVRRVRFG